MGKAIHPEVRRICDELWEFKSLSDLEEILGEPRSDQIERVANPHVQGETVRIHAIEFIDASAQAIEAPSGSRSFAVSRLRINANFPGLRSSRWIGVPDQVLRSQIGHADDDSGIDLVYICDPEAVTKIAFSIGGGAVRAISWYPYVDQPTRPPHNKEMQSDEPSAQSVPGTPPSRPAPCGLGRGRLAPPGDDRFPLVNLLQRGSPLIGDPLLGATNLAQLLMTKKPVQYAPTTKIEQREREVQLLLNVVEPDPEYQAFLFPMKHRSWM